MNRPFRARRLAVAAVAVLLPLTAVACTSGSDGGGGDGGSTPPATPVASPPATTPTAGTTAAPESPATSATEGASGQPVTQPFGSGCPNLPETGVGSLQDLSEQGVATAVSEVPQLSQLGVTVRFAELQGTLNNASDVTVFAPNDAAFQSLGLDRARKLVADPSQAVGVLKYHVVPKRLSPEELPGTHETLEAGKSLTVKGSGQDFTVNDAKVVCGNIQAANGTIYLIDGVLQP